MMAALFSFVLIVLAFFLGRLAGVYHGLSVGMNAYTHIINRALKNDPEAKERIADELLKVADGRIKTSELV